MKQYWVLSCEHGGNEIPPAYASLFANAGNLLSTHRGWDPGALELFEQLKPLADFSYNSTISRLLVELNRSLHHPNLFSAYSRTLEKQEKQRVLAQYYHPYRAVVEDAIKKYIQQGATVYHLSIHSFTPVLNGEVRNADIGLLYDPARKLEREASASFKKALQDQIKEVRVRLNYPYLGTADGFTTYLRRQFPEKYAGIEFELNQQWAGDQNIYEKIVGAAKELKKSIS